MIGQYANSPVLVSLDDGLRSLFDDSGFVKDWYDTIINIKTATGYGLDIWGRILNMSREVNYGGTTYYLKGAQTIVGKTFTDSEMEDFYRLILQITAMRYLGNASMYFINNVLAMIWGKYGRAYCVEYGPMQIRYVFEFYLDDVLKAMIESLNMHPSGVITSYEYLPLGDFMGFHVASETQPNQPYTPFDVKPFYQ